MCTIKKMLQNNILNENYKRNSDQNLLKKVEKEKFFFSNDDQNGNDKMLNYQ